MDVKDIEFEFEGVDWIHVAQYRDQWWTVLNMVMNIQVP
jgi:hypothetical protein